jgi:hypothetical protein
MGLKVGLIIFVAAFNVLPAAPGKQFPHALAHRGCTQEDAPALEIYLIGKPQQSAALPPKPYLRIEVAGRNWQHLLRKDLKLVPLSRQGTDREKPLVRAELNLAQQRQTVWLQGTLRLTKIEDEKEVTGSYDFTAPGERRWKGEFKAVWAKGGGGCG